VDVRATHQARIERKPSRNLRTCLEDLGKLKEDNSQNRVMFSHALVANSDCDDGVSPVADESFCAGFKDWLAGDYFGSCFIDLELVSNWHVLPIDRLRELCSKHSEDVSLLLLCLLQSLAQAQILCDCHKIR